MTPNAIVVGAGPNGLAAAVTLAQAGWAVEVFEAGETAGGGARSAELTRPDFVHDVCSAIYPLAAGSPFLAHLPLARHGLEWLHPPLPLAHPFADGTAAVLARSFEETGESFADRRGRKECAASPIPGSSSARRARRPREACTACADTTRRRRCYDAPEACWFSTSEAGRLQDRRRRLRHCY